MIRQRTIKDTVDINGIGLQTGREVRLKLKPSPANSGINFIRVDLPNKPLLNIQSLDLRGTATKERRTALGLGPLEIQTTEHFLSALSGLGVDNIVAEMDGSELPGLDGSAKDFVTALKGAGISEQDAPKRFLEIKEPVWVSGKDAFLAVFPDEAFKVSYTLSYSAPELGSQFFSTVIDNGIFEREIAPARTFCLEQEAMMLLKMGLGKGANYDNTLVIGKDGPIKTAARFADEPARHKVLDLIGDLYILGVRIKGHVVAIKSGHRLNFELVKKLKSLEG